MKQLLEEIWLLIYEFETVSMPVTENFWPWSYKFAA